MNMNRCPLAGTGRTCSSRSCALVRDDLAACNRTIVEHMDSPVALIPQLARQSSPPAASGCARC